MTDEQWLWLFIHDAVDRDEKLEHMCTSCRDEATSGNRKCIKCGKSVGHSETFTNPNFDVDRYNALANGTEL